jgi:hypothetical protein
MAVSVTEGGLRVVRQQTHGSGAPITNQAIGPTCRLASSPDVGPGATVSTLKQGYPLLPYEDAVPMHLSLVAW